MTLARTPYARLSPADIGQVDRELKKLEQMSAGLYVPKVLVAARSPYTVQGTDTMLLCDCTAGAITLTFPLAARVDGMSVQVVKSDTSANAVTLSGTFSGMVNPTIAVQDSSFTAFAMNGAYHITAFVLYPIVPGEAGVVSFVYPYGDVRRYGATGVAGTNARAAFAAADAAAIAGYGGNKAVRVPAGTHRIASNITIASGMVFDPGAILKPDSGVTVTINGAIITAVLGRIFDTSAGGTIVVAKTAAPRFYAQWWGGAGDGTTDSTAALNAVLANIKTNGGGTLESTAGTWKTTSVVNIIETRDLYWVGAGRFSTVIQQTVATQPAVQINGMWYSRFEGLQFIATASLTGKAVFEIDGNYDGTHTLSVQGNSFRDCIFNGNLLADYATAICRQGGGSGQGSENLFENCHWFAGNTACYYQNGFNALQNTIIGGNFQSYPKHGIQLVAGSVFVYSVGFQSTYAYQQILNGGFDIDASSAGANDRVIVDGCRTESLSIARSGGSQQLIIRGHQNEPGALNVRLASTAYALNAAVAGLTAAGNKKLFVVTTAGTTGGGASVVWPESGTLVDGTLTWTEIDYDAVQLFGGSSITDSYIQLGQVMADSESSVTKCLFRRNDPFNKLVMATLGGDSPILWGNTYKAAGGSPSPIMYGNTAGATHRTTNPKTMNLGDGALVFTTGGSFFTGWDVGWQSGNSDHNSRAANTTKALGGVQLDSFTFAEIGAGASPPNGTLAFVSDGTPASNPLTGAGTGCIAIRQGGAWKGL